MRVKFLHWALMLTALLFFSGCSSMMSSDGTDGDGAPVTDSSDGASTSGASRGGAWTGNPLDNPDSPLSTRTIYFDFDKSDIRAEYLVSNPSMSLTVEGHCDERGSREYNIGLGERRASAIKRFLEAEGVRDSQVNTISYGEERPVDEAHHEAAWAMNRRGELVY